MSHLAGPADPEPPPPPSTVPAERRRPLAALGAVLGFLLLASLLGSGVLILTPALMLLQDLEPPFASSGEPFIQVWSFEEAAPGSGRHEALTEAVAQAGLSARWSFDRGAGRTAFECGDDCFDEPLGDNGALASIFRDQGFVLDEDYDVTCNYSGGLTGPWGFNLLMRTWFHVGPSLGLLLVGWLLRRSLTRGRQNPPPRISAGRSLPLGLVLGGGMAVLGIPLIHGSRWLGLPGSSPFLELPTLSSSGVSGFALTILAGAVLAPLTEEIFFRGWAVPYLERRAGTALAYLAPALLWAAIHLDPVRIPTLFLMGLGLAWAYRRWRSLLVPVSAHATVNAIALVYLKLNTQPF